MSAHAESPTRKLAILSLENPMEKAVCELIHHMHTGRHPTWKMHTIRREGDFLVEVAEWRRGVYCVLTWSLTVISVQMQNYPSRAAAMRAYKEAVGHEKFLTS